MMKIIFWFGKISMLEIYVNCSLHYRKCDVIKVEKKTFTLLLEFYTIYAKN